MYHLKGEHLGLVHSLVADKDLQSDRLAAASFGLSRPQQSYHLLPWRVLRDDVRQGGYPIELDQRRLAESLSYSAGNLPNRRCGHPINYYEA